MALAPDQDAPLLAPGHGRPPKFGLGDNPTDEPGHPDGDEADDTEHENRRTGRQTTHRVDHTGDVTAGVIDIDEIGVVSEKRLEVVQQRGDPILTRPGDTEHHVECEHPALPPAPLHQPHDDPERNQNDGYFCALRRPPLVGTARLAELRDLRRTVAEPSDQCPGLQEQDRYAAESKDVAPTPSLRRERACPPLTVARARHGLSCLLHSAALSGSRRARGRACAATTLFAFVGILCSCYEACQ